MITPKVVTSVLLLAAMLATVQASVPKQVTVQGRLTELTGAPVVGANPFEFRIFNAEVGGTQIWPQIGSELQNLTVDSSGLWSTSIGVFVELTDAVFSDTVRWLQVTVDGTTLPRIRLATGPFAFRVATVDGATGGTISGKLSIGPGQTNTGLFAFVTGTDNQATGNYSVVGGGTLNKATGESSTIAGGQQNDATGFASAISGGASNDAANSHSVVSGGVGNVASGLQSSIGGGSYNTATAYASRVSGGSSNSADADGAVVGGGGNNHARGAFSTIAGGGGANPGDSNAALGMWSFVGGGTENVAGEWASTVSGGFVNLALDSVATVSGGVANGATGFGSTIGGGSSNAALGTYSTIAGGLGNHVVDSCAAVGGGGYNRVHGAYSTIAGGGGNLAEDSNSILGWWGAIGGGRRNLVGDGYNGTVAGGFSNAAGHFAAVGGGGWNQAWSGATIAGGESNTAGGIDAAVGGGTYNRAMADYSTVPGGEGNHATGRHSFAAGEGARAHHNNSFVWSDGTIWLFDSAASTSESQFIIMTSGNVGIGLSNPTDRLHVHNGNIRTNGCLIGSNLLCPSDTRLKEDIHTLDHALDRVGRLRGVEYRWRDEVIQKQSLPVGPQVGLIAQEVQDVVPQAVIKGSDGYLTVDYTRLVPLLIEGMKEQQKQIEMQQYQIDQLIKKLEQ